MNYKIMNKLELEKQIKELKELLANNPDWGIERKKSLEDYIKLLESRLKI